MQEERYDVYIQYENKKDLVAENVSGLYLKLVLEALLENCVLTDIQDIRGVYAEPHIEKKK